MSDFKTGDRIELIRMEDDPNPVKPGERGTVREIYRVYNNQAQIWVNWDNGRNGIAVILPIDEIKLVT